MGIKMCAADPAQLRDPQRTSLCIIVIILLHLDPAMA
jgi:hypothetical protein